MNLFSEPQRTRACACLCVLQEGHTAHATPEEAEEEAMKMIRVYEQFAVTQVST